MKNTHNLQFAENRMVFMGFGTPKGAPKAKSSAEKLPTDKLGKVTKDALDLKMDKPTMQDIKSASKKFVEGNVKNGVAAIKKITNAAKKEFPGTLESDDPRLNQVVDTVHDKIWQLGS